MVVDIESCVEPFLNDMFRDAKDEKELFTRVAEMQTYCKWEELVKSLNGRKPTFEELVDGTINAYIEAHKMNPALGFKNDEEFETWLGFFEEGINEHREEYLESALQAYEAIKKGCELINEGYFG